MKNFYVRNSCRLCGSKNIDLVLPLKQSPLCDAYVHTKKPQESYDLDVYLCGDCQFVQINTIVDPETIYRDYIYVTTSSTGLAKHFNAYASEVCDALQLQSSNLTVDIGSNDGTLLKCFKDRGHKVLGVEPSIKTAEDATQRGLKTLPEFFDKNVATQITEQYGHADLITINNLFANIDDLEAMVAAIDVLLAKDGVLVVESSYLLDMIENMVFDFIYHEHLSYFSVLPLVKFFKRFNMRLIRIDNVGTKGGSLRYYIARNDSRWEPHESVQRCIQREEAANVSVQMFKAFEQRIATAKERLKTFFDNNKDKKIVGYGASATSTTLISHFEIAGNLDYLVDDNPGKINTYSPGFHIPVYSSDKLTEEPADILLIIAWRYKKEILEKLPTNPKQIVMPLPEFEVL